MRPLIAFHNSQAEKDAILTQLQRHYDADEIIKGVYWERGKGCAVGCTVHSSDHMRYEPRFGIPVALAYLEDRIFEGMGNGDSKQWPLRFMRAIPVGADLSRIRWQFLHWLLTDEKVNPGINHPLVKDAVANVATLMAAVANGDEVSESAAWLAARSAGSAGSAARSAGSAWSATWSAWSAAASAESAAQAAAQAAGSAARSAESAAQAAAQAAGSAARSAESAGSAEAYLLMADKLAELAEHAPQAVAT